MALVPRLVVSIIMTSIAIIQDVEGANNHPDVSGPRTLGSSKAGSASSHLAGGIDVRLKPRLET